ncbi:MAG: hypothetical protein N2971_08505 [Chlorobi bacterium]|nr:hypothetical protein [Chlorobiota bacterium]
MYQRVVRWLLVISATGAQVVAQPSPPAIEFSGSNVLSGQTASRQGSYQEQPAQFWRWEFEPTVQVYGIPLSFYVLLSSEQQEFRQNINAITSMFTPERLRQRILDRLTSEVQSLPEYSDVADIADRYAEIKDSLAQFNPAMLERIEAYRRIKELQALKNADPLEQLDKLRQLGLVSGIEQVMMYLPQVQVGMVYPNYSQYLLRGVALNGGSVDWTPGTFLFSFAGGKTRRPILRRDSLPLSNYEQEMYAARFGFGHGTATSVTFSALSARDEGASLPDTLRPLQGSPYATHVLGMQLSSALWDRRITLDGEIAASLVTWDVRSPRPTEDQLPGWLVRMFDLRLSSSADFAYSLRLAFVLPETGSRLALQSRMVGPGFFSYGAPLLRRDVLLHEVRLDQTLFSRVLTLGVGYRTERDNLLGTKLSTTLSNIYTGSLGIAPRLLPYLRASGTYSEQQSSFGTQITATWQLATGYVYQFGMTGGMTAVTYGEQRTSGWSAATGLRSITFDQSFTFEFPLTVSLAVQAGLPMFEGDTITRRNWLTTLTGTYTFWEMLSVSLMPSLAADGDATRFIGGFRIQLDLKQWGVLRIEANTNRFRDPLNPALNFDETFLRAAFEQRW